jgi:hypothetical protein
MFICMVSPQYETSFIKALSHECNLDSNLMYIHIHLCTHIGTYTYMCMGMYTLAHTMYVYLHIGHIMYVYLHIGT